MNIGDAEVWQIAAGDTNRSYAELCLKWGVVLFGPGERGRWPECEDRLRGDRWSSRKIGMIRKYHEEIQNGDIVVLRLGTSEVYGVGKVEGPVEWYDDFGDIDGWDIQLVRRVRWIWKPADDGKPKRFSAGALKWGDTVHKLNRSGPVFEWLSELPERDTDLPELPPSCKPGNCAPRIDIPELAEHLFDQGTAAGAISELTDGILGLKQIASWYRRRDAEPSERETVAYLTVPLLRTLGWTPQRMAVEWGRIDIALFDKLPRDDANLAVVVEVKQLGYSCFSAKSQAIRYAEEAGRDSCRRAVVTDGIRYGIYVRDKNGTFPSTPAAYMNLNRMVGSYPVLGCEGMPAALSLLAADWRTGWPRTTPGSSGRT